MKVNEKSIFLAFDIDGTIYDAGDIIEESFRLGIESISEKWEGKTLHIPTREEITVTLGYPLNEITMMLSPYLEEHERNELSLIWTVNLVKMIKEKKGNLIEGVEETVKILNSMNYHMLVASNGARDYVEAILDTYNLKRFFSEPFIYSEGAVKNKTDIIDMYLKLNPGIEIIMIGDRYTDLAAARENGVPVLGCAFGHAGADEIEGEKYIVNSFSEIPEILKKIKVSQYN